MAFLKPAEIEQSAAKFGIFARQGAGKTTTAILIMIGLSKTYHKGAPIGMMDTETGSDFIKPICDAEGVKLIVGKSKAFADMKAGLREAEQAGCCGYLVDSYTHPWKELCDAFKEKSRRKKLEFHHMDELKTLWGMWTQQMLSSPLHVGLAGRLGFEWGEETDDEGTKSLIKLGTKMKSEAEAGYEPNLLIELEAMMPTQLEKKTRKRGAIVHRATVLKDRWRELNGRTFEWKTMNSYKAGGYLPIFESFLSHWSKLKIGGVQRAVDGTRSSGEMFPGSEGESTYRQLQTRREVALAEAQGILMHLWPGQKTEEKAVRSAIGAKLFDAYSWEAVGTKPLELIENAVRYLRLFKDTLENAAEPPVDVSQLLALLELCQAKVDEPLGGTDAVKQELAGQGAF